MRRGTVSYECTRGDKVHGDDVEESGEWHGRIYGAMWRYRRCSMERHEVMQTVMWRKWSHVKTVWMWDHEVEDEGEEGDSYL
jgi:hypothetical protein